MLQREDSVLSRDEIDDLADEIAVTACRVDSAQQVLLGHIRAFDRAKGWAWQGAKSCAAWLCWRIGCGRNAANERVRVATALGSLPRIDAAMAAGELSYCKVRAMTRVATPENEELLLEQARSATGAELERICAGVRRAARPRGARGDDDVRYVRRRQVAGGMTRIEAQLYADEAERVWQALSAVRRELEGAPGGHTAAAEVGAAALALEVEVAPPAPGGALGDAAAADEAEVVGAGFGGSSSEHGREITAAPAPPALDEPALPALARAERGRGIAITRTTSLVRRDFRRRDLRAAANAVVARTLAPQP